MRRNVGTHDVLARRVEGREQKSTSARRAVKADAEAAALGGWNNCKALVYGRARLAERW